MINKFSLKNGSQVIFAPNNATEATTILVMFGVGSRYETKSQNGLSHYLEHLFFKGTKNRTSTFAIAKELDSLGSSYNAFTGEEYTGYYIESEKQNLPKTIEVIADLLQNPLFNKQELEQEKKVIIEEINMYEDFPQRYVQELAKLNMFGDTPLGRDIAGTKDIVRSLDKNSVIQYKKTHYHAGNMHLVIAGNFQEKSITTLVNKYFSKVPKLSKLQFEKAKINYNKPKLKLKYKNTDQGHLVLGFPGLAYNDPDKISLDLLSTILGGGMSSRLFIQVRERRGLGYYVRNESANFHDSGMFFAHAGIKTNKIGEAIKTIINEFSQIQTGKISEEELQKAKNQSRGKLALELEKSQSMAMFLGEQSIYGQKIRDAKELLRDVNKITLKDIQNVAKKIILPGLINLSIIGPYKNKNKFQKIINSGI